MATKQGKAGVWLLLLAIIAIAVYFFSNPGQPPGNEGQPDMQRSVFIELQAQDRQEVVSISCVLNPDNTGSITNRANNNSAEQGTWKLQTQTNDMVKIIFTARGYNYLVTLYRNRAASLAGGNFQYNGQWHQ